MATSGAMSTSNQFIKYTIIVTQNSQSIANNTSNVTVSVRFYRTNTGYTSYGTGTVYCKINGTTYNAGVTPSQKITNSGIVLFNKTLNITHDSAGAKILTCSAWISHNVVTSSEQSYSQTLTTIPRASEFGAISGNTIGSTMTVNISRKVSSFTHQLWYKVGNSAWYDLGTGIGTSKSFTIAMETCSQITTSTSGVCQLCIRTFSGSTRIGADVYKNVTVYVPASVKPGCTISVSDAMNYVGTYGGYIQSLSKAKVIINATTSYGSAIASYRTTIDGVNYTTSSFTSNALKTSDTITITTTVTDKRGRTTTATANITVLAYNPPQLTNLSASRCNSDGGKNDAGAYMKIMYTYVVSALNNKNVVSANIQHKKSTETSYSTTSLTGITNLYSVTNNYIVLAADTGASYNILFTLSDKFNSVKRSTSLSTGYTIMHWKANGKGVGIGKIAEMDNYLDVEYTIYARNGLKYPTLPPGTNLNTVRTAGVYHCVMSTNYTNAPPFSQASYFVLEVFDNSGVIDGSCMQRATCNGNQYENFTEFIRYSNGVTTDTWTSWVCTNGSAKLPDGADLNAITTWGMYYSREPHNVGYKNMPYAQSYTFSLEVGPGGDSGQIRQRLTSCNKECSKTFERFYYQNTWGTWECISGVGVNVLWTGASYMNKSQTITLAESILLQPHGVVLIFSEYDGGAKNANFASFFVSKYSVKMHATYGNVFSYNGTWHNMCKYLYIGPTTITGHDTNQQTFTVGGVNNTNNKSVLRYVVGV